MTLRVDGDYRQAAVLNPEAPLGESGLRSGATVALVEHREQVESPIGAVVRIVEGPDRGIEVPIRIGSSSIGRGPTPDVRLTDPRRGATPS